MNKHQRATNEPSDGPRLPRGAAGGGRLFLPAPPKRLSLLGCLGWLAQPRSPTQAAQRGGYSDRFSERSRGLVDARVVREAKREEKLGLRRPCVFSMRRGWSTLTVLGAVGRRAAAAPMALSLGDSGFHL